MVALFEREIAANLVFENSSIACHTVKWAGSSTCNHSKTGGKDDKAANRRPSSEQWRNYMTTIKPCLLASRIRRRSGDFCVDALPISVSWS